jgi:hypothetical protein
MKRTVLGMVMAAVMALSACSSPQRGIDEGDEGGTGGGSTATLRVQNYSDWSIWYLYVSPSVDDDWGPDQLGSSTIPSGSSFTVTGIPCGRSYDLRAEDSGHGVMAERYGVYFACGDTMTWTLY